ncbi:MAG: VIT domain-containing protein, partial [Caldimonas sp.]
MSIHPCRVSRRRFTGLAAAASFACMSAAAQVGTPALLPPLPVRAPLLQVAGAERPVRLESLKVDVEVAGGVAETRVEMVFFNPNGRTLEGKLQFPLAPGQVVSGFALDVDGKLRDAVPVDKARGQQVFEEIVRRGVDPGLLQTTEGNNHELRIYPLLAGKTRTVMLRLVEPAGQRLRIPLAYAPRVADFAFSVRTAASLRPPVLDDGAGLGMRFERDPRGGFVARVARSDAALPAEPIVIRGADDHGEAPAITTEQRDGTSWFTLELAVPAGRAARPLPRQVQIVWDASASAANRVRDREFALLDAYFARAGDITVRLVRVSDTATAPERFDVRRGDWRALRAALVATALDGASNLGAVRHDGVSGEALWFSDGLANYGAPWRLRFPVPVFAISSATSGDPAALQAFADHSGGRSIDLGVLSRQAAADALLLRGSVLEAVSAVGARDIVVQSQSAASGRLVLAGAFTAPRADVTVRLRDAAGATTVRTIAVTAGQNASRLAAVQWARLTLASLEGEARTNRVRIREIGRQFGLATRETSLIVLELVSDYARHEIDPPAELRAAYEQLRATAARQKSQGDAARLAQVVRRFEERAAWWRRDFPKGPPPAPLEVARQRAGDHLEALAGALRQDDTRSRPSTPAPTRAPASALADAPAGFAAASKNLAAKEDKDGSAPAASIRIAIAPAASGSASIRRIEAAPAGERLRVYFDERLAQAGNVGFFLDAAEFFISHGERALGLRVLSNLAEMDLQNR